MANKLLRQSSIELQLEAHQRKDQFKRSFSSSDDDFQSKLLSPTRKRAVYDVIANLTSIDENNTSSTNNNNNTAKSILVRVDFNVPMSPTGKITDDSRIRGALPTIRRILAANCNVILISHMGRPKIVQKNGNDDDDATRDQRRKLSLAPIAHHLSTLLLQPVSFAADCIGSTARAAVDALPRTGGGVLVLENLRFYKEEETNDETFAAQLASLADGYVNDAFGTCHRAHASVSGVPRAMRDASLCGIGLLVEAELSYLDFERVDRSSSHVAAIIGGSKVSTKLPVIEGLMGKVDTLVLGGGLAFTFLKAMGVSIGNSLCEESMINTARGLLEKAEREGKRIVLPVDAVCAMEFPKGPLTMDETKTFDLVPGTNQGVEDGWSGFDVGSKTLDVIKESLIGVTKLVMNGPLGVFEIPPFEKGTGGLIDILEQMTQRGCVTVVGGGDSVAALEMFNKAGAVSYVSTGGGATLELLSGIVLPGVAAIEDVED